MAGCANEDRPRDIPPTAQLMTEGSGELAYKAPHDGTIYVYDTRDDRLIYSGKVEHGQLVTVNPKSDAVSLDSKKVFEGNLRGGNNRTIYFEPKDHMTLDERHDLDRDRERRSMD
jgi:hypothetical protein